MKFEGHLLLIIGVSLATGRAAADESAKRPRLREIQEEAKRRRHSNDYSGALASYQLAYELDPDARVLLSIATTLKILGRDPEAADAYEQYLSDPGRDARKVPEVKAALADLATRLASRKLTHLKIVVPRLRVRIRLPDRYLFAPGLGSRERPLIVRVDPGDVSVSMLINGMVYGTQSHRVSASGKNETLKLDAVVPQWEVGHKWMELGEYKKACAEFALFCESRAA